MEISASVNKLHVWKREPFPWQVCPFTIGVEGRVCRQGSLFHHDGMMVPSRWNDGSITMEQTKVLGVVSKSEGRFREKFLAFAGNLLALLGKSACSDGRLSQRWWLIVAAVVADCRSGGD